MALPTGMQAQTVRFGRKIIGHVSDVSIWGPLAADSCVVTLYQALKATDPFQKFPAIALRDVLFLIED